MKVNLIKTPDALKSVQCLFVCLVKKEDYKKHVFSSLVSKGDNDFIGRVLETETNWGDKKTLVIPLPSNPSRKLIFLGIPGNESWNRRRRQAAIRKAVLLAKDARVSRIAIFLNDFTLPNMTEEEAVRTAVENVLLADFAFTRYKEEPKGGWPKIGTVDIIVPRINKSLEKALEEGVIIGEEVNHCRVLANTPGGDMTPQKLAEAALGDSKRIKSLKVKVLEEKEIEKLGMGGVIGVSRGSAERPKFILIEYWGGSKNKKPLVFVGKGVTFDTGGLNLKPSDEIYEMHLDMSGGSAVINALSAIARLKLPVNVIGLVPAVENMPSGSSYRPGDVLKSITGKTIEVLNTDAEGRIILADALGYAHRYKPELIVDVATLTGSAMVALGQRVTALFTNGEKLETLARLVGEKSGDEVWPLPLWDEYTDDIQGTFGDVANASKTRYGGATLGAVFLKQFVGGYPWIHLDIAPTMTAVESQNLAKGASGVGVRFLVELAREYINR